MESEPPSNSSSRKRVAGDCGSSASAKKKSQQFRAEYTKKWPYIIVSKKGCQFAFCKLCRSDICIGHGGRNDISRHVESRKHKDILSSRQGASITNFFGSPTTSTSESASEHALEVTRAEVLMVELIAHHNLPLAAADTFTGGFKRMFPDSRIAAG